MITAYRSAAQCFRRLLIMDMAQILCTPKNVPSFLGVYPSDILPPITRSATLIVNTDPHTASGTPWLAIHLQPRSYSGYFFDSYGLPPLVPNILTFYTVRAPSGNTLLRSCRASPVVCANIAVYSHSTWTAGTLLNSLWASSMPHRQKADQPLLRIRIRAATYSASRWSELCTCYIYKS